MFDEATAKYLPSSLSACNFGSELPWLHPSLKVAVTATLEITNPSVVVYDLIPAESILQSAISDGVGD